MSEIIKDSNIEKNMTLSEMLLKWWYFKTLSNLSSVNIMLSTYDILYYIKYLDIDWNLYDPMVVLKK